MFFFKKIGILVHQTRSEIAIESEVYNSNTIFEMSFKKLKIMGCNIPFKFWETWSLNEAISRYF